MHGTLKDVRPPRTEIYQTHQQGQEQQNNIHRFKPQFDGAAREQADGQHAEGDDKLPCDSKFADRVRGDGNNEGGGPGFGHDV